ncbi:MAG: uroporphyrinogen decarboxylase family protein [Planctomycetota bacterium]
MNSRDRIAAVLEHGRGDRVPLGELWIDPGVAEAILPGASAVELVEHLGMDLVTVPTMIYEEDEVEWVDRKRRVFRDKWGALQIAPGKGVPVPTAPARIETEEDLAGYRPPDPAKSPVPGKVRKLKERYPNGEKAIAVVGESGWAPAVFLRGGLQNLLLDFGLRPGFAKELMRIGVEYYCELYRSAVREGADVVLLGDDYSDKNGPMMSPAQFEEIILPGDAAVVAAIQSAGAHCIKHTDGDIRKIMDMLVGTGVDCLGPLEPVPGMELERIFERYPGKIAVMGNLSIDLLSRGSAEEVRRATKRVLATVSARGPHILSSANTIAASVKPENFVAMVETAREFGEHPIDAEELLDELGGR